MRVCIACLHCLQSIRYKFTKSTAGSIRYKFTQSTAESIRYMFIMSMAESHEPTPSVPQAPPPHGLQAPPLRPAARRLARGAPWPNLNNKIANGSIAEPKPGA